MTASGQEPRTHSRPLRWHQWLLILLLLAAAGGVRGATVYKCISPNGDIAYQSQQCPAGAAVRVIDLGVAPAYRPSPQYAVERNGEPAQKRARGAGARKNDVDAMSFECRTSDGAVFYRHAGCPRSVAAHAGQSAATNHGRGTAGGSGGAGGAAAVSATRIARADACREMTRAGAIGRSGREHDESISTYERNLGHDPCR